MEIVTKIINAIDDRLKQDIMTAEFNFLTDLKKEIIFDYQKHYTATELNELNSVDEGEKSFWCFRIEVDEQPIEQKCEKQCTYCRINHSNDFIAK